MDRVIPALIIAFISAISFIAYKHPKPFKALFGLLAILSMVVSVALLAWEVGVNSTFIAVMGFVEADKIKEAKAAIDSYQIPYWVFLAGLGFICYLNFLRFILPMLLDEDQPENK